MAKGRHFAFVAMRLKHENCFGGLIDRMATRFSTWFVFKTMNRRYVSFLKQNSIEVHTHELNWRPECLVRLMKVNGRSIHRNSASDGCSLSSKFAFIRESYNTPAMQSSYCAEAA